MLMKLASSRLSDTSNNNNKLIDTVCEACGKLDLVVIFGTGTFIIRGTTTPGPK